MSVTSAEMETTLYSHSEKKTQKITIQFKDAFQNNLVPLNKMVLLFGVDPNGEVYFSSATLDNKYISNPSKLYPYLYKQEVSRKMDQIVLNHAKDVLLRSIH
jgi:hypothetical protein